MGIITLFTGLIVLISGIFVASNASSTFSSVAFVVGLTLLVLGIVLGIGYWIGSKYKTMNKHYWVLVDAIMAVFLGIIILANGILVESSVPYILGMWCMYSGMMRVIVGKNINFKKKKTNFIAAVGSGILLMLVGSLAFTVQYFGSFSTNELIGLFIIVQGIATIELGINKPHNKRNYDNEIESNV